MPIYKMKRLILVILAFVLLLPSIKANETYFPYPQPPEELTTLAQRSNYLVEHFWDRCNFKSAFSSTERLKNAFCDYIAFMPYAAPDTVHTSINNLIDKVKKNPKNLLTLAIIAEATLYGDSAMYWSDELYLPFAEAVVNTKKISKTDRARFEHQVSILKGSQVGMTAPNLELITPLGETIMLDSISAQHIILFFNDPDCDDCRIAKTRMSANLEANNLINAGVLKIVSIYPGEPDEEWIAETTDYPKNWIVGASVNADLLYDMRTKPTLYYLQSNHEIVLKNLVIDNVLNAFILLNNSLNKE